MLVRGIDDGWTKGSVIAVDAGVQLAAITKILQETQPEGLGTTVSLPYRLEEGPFAGVEIQSNSAMVNAGSILRWIIDTFLVTHPHLDHISGFVINTAGPPGARPKRLVGTSSTISAIKTHIFNNVIWPNLSDENNGAGLVTFLRLVEGGSPAIGDGNSKGYLELTDSLAVKLFSVSHGHCIERHPARGSVASLRYSSFDASAAAGSPRGAPGSTAASGPPSLFRGSNAGQDKETISVYDSSAYFIRDNESGREILIFGDVEPDTMSLSPRNLHIWEEAAPRIANGNLAAIFIECSYDNSQSDDRLFGHLTPRYLIQELQTLAATVETVALPQTTTESTKKRKRATEAGANTTDTSSSANGDDRAISPKSVRPVKKPTSITAGPDRSGVDTPHIATPIAEMSLHDIEAEISPHTQAPLIPKGSNALKGLKVIVIHVKDKLVDGALPGDVILAQLLEAEEEAQLGCQFIISRAGQSFLF
ncbi:cAMP phosphodiesterase class-II [Xylaria arbuscula]|nr:cAMP phosphodiesterase class-II [Xylaria arbuscula]